MTHTVKHFSLNHIAGTELRVLADVETGVLPVVEAEEAVIRGYAQLELWPHQCVSLFILRDLQPLVRQLGRGTGSESLQVHRRIDPLGPGAESPSRRSLPPGGAEGLDHRPVVNVYDLADSSACHVFVNQRAMAKEGYWDDPVAIKALLAHEHAHPLAENDTTRASRRLQMELSLELASPVLATPGSRRMVSPSEASEAAPPRAPLTTGREHGRREQAPQAVAGPSGTSDGHYAADWHNKIHRLVALMADKLCLYAPREIFANELTIRSGFGDALLHLDELNVANASRSVSGRGELREQLEGEVSRQSLTAAGADALLLVGDMKGYLDLALEVAPFYRAGREGAARQLEAVLETNVFPHLEPEVPRAYGALREAYIALRAELTPSDFVAWAEGVLKVLAESLAEKGLNLEYRLRKAEGGST